MSPHVFRLIASRFHPPSFPFIQHACCRGIDPFAQIVDDDATEAAYRLADIAQLMLVSSSSASEVVPTTTDSAATQARVPSSAPASDAAATATTTTTTTTTAEPTVGLDYTGRSTLALDMQRMCHLLLQSATAGRGTTPSSERASSSTNPSKTDEADEEKAGDGRDNGIAGVGSSGGGGARERLLTLTASTMRAIEEKVKRGNFRDISGEGTPTPGRRRSSAVSSSSALAGVERLTFFDDNEDGDGDDDDDDDDAGLEAQPPAGPLHVDPKLFLNHVHQNTTLEVSAVARIIMNTTRT